MDLKQIQVGKNPPHEVNAVIEIQGNAAGVKYEFDKKSGALFVDRFIQAAMHYPCHYGFVPHTLSGDGDPVDILVLVPEKVIPGSVIAVRPIGVLITEDESGKDEKILAVPTAKAYPPYGHINSYQELPEITCERIKHFFEHYKDLEKGKWVKVTGWEGPERAKLLIQESIVRFEKSM